MVKLNVIYEDNHIIVVEKPVNIPSQQDKTGDLDMLTIIKDYLKNKYNKPGNVYLGLVHRLDRPVGGVMVFAKTSKAASRLSEQVRNKELKKDRYVRQVLSKVQKMTKQHGFEVLDRINLYVAGTEELEEVIRKNEELIKHDTLANKVIYHEERDNYVTTNINGEKLDIDVEVVK